MKKIIISFQILFFTFVINQNLNAQVKTSTISGVNTSIGTNLSTKISTVSGLSVKSSTVSGVNTFLGTNLSTKISTVSGLSVKTSTISGVNSSVKSISNMPTLVTVNSVNLKVKK